MFSKALLNHRTQSESLKSAMIETRPSSFWRRLAVPAAKGLISIGLLLAVLHRVNVREILVQIQSVRLGWIYTAAGMFALNTLFLARRWALLSLGTISFFDALKYTWIGLFFGAVIPGGISGDIGKGVSLAIRSKARGKMQIAATIVCDKVVGLAVLLCFFVLSVVFARWANGGTIPQSFERFTRECELFIALAVGVCVLAMLARQRLAALISRLSSDSRAGRLVRTLRELPIDYANRKYEVAAAAALSAVGHLSNAGAYWFILRSMSLDISLVFSFFLYSTLSVVTMIPISISGIGVRDVTAAGLFSVFGLSSALGVEFSWLVLGLNIPMVLIGAAVQLYESFSAPRS